MANRFWVGGTGTWDAADTTFWAATSGGAGGQSVPVAGDVVTFDANSGGGTVTVNHATLNVASITMGAFTGTLDFATNDNNITLTTGFSASGTGIRTLNMGDGTWTLSAAGSGVGQWDCATVTNFTLNANGSTILFSNSAPSARREFSGGGKTYNIFTIAAQTTGVLTKITGSNTFATLNVGVGVNLSLANNITVTITNAFTWAGNASNRFVIGSEGATSATIVATGGGSIDYAMLYAITFTTGVVNATNSYNLRSTAGVTITEPAGGGMLAHPGMNGRLAA